jgi:hypothetical protein
MNGQKFSGPNDIAIAADDAVYLADNDFGLLDSITFGLVYFLVKKCPGVKTAFEMRGQGSAHRGNCFRSLGVCGLPRIRCSGSTGGVP